MFKKYLPGLLAIAFAISASALTSRHSTDQQYYKNDAGRIVPVTSTGVCINGNGYCTYSLIPGQPDNGDLENYEGTGAPNKQFVPTP